MFAALQYLNFHTNYLDLSDIIPGHDDITLKVGQETGFDKGGTLIIHLNPPELPLAYREIGRLFTRHRRIIGYWAWELPDIPPNWKRAFRLVDEIWVPSRFVADAIRRNTLLPVRVVPHPVQVPASALLTRASFRLPEDAFVCLSMFDMCSSASRKNPLGTIRAFNLAFGTNQKSILVLKVTHGDMAPAILGEIKDSVGSSSNIKIIDSKLSSEHVVGLISCADTVVSLHRSEGFGLVLAEAMMLGKPVVATGWSGNMDFMNSENAALVDYDLVPVQDPQNVYPYPDQHWAEPNVEHAATWLRVLASNRTLARKIGERAARDARRLFALNAYRRRIESCGISILHSS
jgi:glycosyltransferase involved in cell wall biosynthesis